ncbi:YvcK family protein [Candidatus Pacearchaeota archaeon]|nr:YvcK family protein [Candidatus Pacearchaeota archaeon]
MKTIVTIGGGTGSYTVLRGLKNYTSSLEAVVSMADDGGSSGELRDEFGVLPPGDVRRCLIALADDSKSDTFRRLFEYRFDGKNQKHNLGNLIMIALESIKGSPVLAIKEAERILNITGRVLPVTIDDTTLYAELENGYVIKGESNISYQKINSKIKRLWSEPPAFIYRETQEALENAGMIVICPGDLYGSIIPNFLVKGAIEAIKNSNAKKVFVCNLVTKKHIEGFTAKDFFREIEKHLGKNVLDYVIINTKRPSEDVVKKYESEGLSFVEPDIEDSYYKVIKGEFLAEVKSEFKTIARHDPQKLAKAIMSLV